MQTQERENNKLPTGGCFYLTFAMLSILRIVSSCGQYAVSMPKFSQYVTGEEHSPYEPWITDSAIGFAAMMNIAVYLPAMFFLMQEGVSARPRQHTQSLSSAMKTAHFIHYYIGYLSLLSAGFGAYLNSIALIERYGKIDHAQLKDDLTIYGLEFTGIIFALGNIYANLSPRFKLYEYNSYALAEMLQERKIPNKKAFFATALLTAFVVPNIAFMGYFSGTRALKRVHGIDPSPTILRMFGYYSAGTMLNFQLFTLIPSIYRKLTNGSLQIHVENKHRCDLPLTAVIKTVGVFDSISTGLNNFTAITSTLHDAFDIDQKNIVVIPVAILTSIITILMQYFSSLRDSLAHVKNDFYRLYGQSTSAVYSRLASTFDEDNDNDLDVESCMNDDIDSPASQSAPIGVTSQRQIAPVSIARSPSSFFEEKGSRKMLPIVNSSRNLSPTP